MRVILVKTVSNWVEREKGGQNLEEMQLGMKQSVRHICFYEDLVNNLIAVNNLDNYYINRWKEPFLHY